MSEEEYKDYLQLSGKITEKLDNTAVYENWLIIQEYIDRAQQKVEQLEKENKRLKEWKEDLLSENVELENIRKEAIEELTYMSTDAYVEDYDIREKHYNLLMNILNKGDNK